MHGLGDQVAGFDEGGGAVGGACGQQDFAVIENFLGQSPVAHTMLSSGSRTRSSLLRWRLADNPPGGIKPTQTNSGLFCPTSSRILDNSWPGALISIS